MIEFELKGIRINVTAAITLNNSYTKKPVERNIKVFVQFWDFSSESIGLYELAFIKATLGYFMHLYWKNIDKNSKNGKDGRIRLHRILEFEDAYVGRQFIHFEGSRDNHQNNLRIYLERNGEKTDEAYLDGHEVLMLDTVISKVISLLRPHTEYVNAISE